MKILIVAPGPRSSTINCYEGHRNAMQENAFVELRSFVYHNMLMYHKASVDVFSPDLGDYDSAVIATTRASRELLADIAIFMPDVIFVVSGTLIPFDTWNYVHQIRRNLKEKFIIAWYMTECPYLDNMQNSFSKYADVLFINDKQSLTRFDPNNDKHVYYLPHSYNPKVHNIKIVNEDKHYASDVLFCGTLFYERLEILSQTDWSNIDLKLISFWNDEIDSKFDNLRQYLHINNTIENAELADYYRQAKISINIHRTRPELTGDVPALDNYKDAYSIGPRLYEIAACGSLIMTDYRQEAIDIFDDSIVIFNDAYELRNQIEYFLHPDNEQERIDKTVAAREKVRECTFENRFDKIVFPVLDSVLEQYNGFIKE